MNKLAASSLAACFLLAACGNREVLSASAGSCHRQGEKVSIVSPEGQVVWESIGDAIRAKTVEAVNSQGFKQKLTVDIKNKTCTLGNQQSDGRLVYALN